MNIDKFEEDIKKCRFCFMCRHLSGVANVTFREADTPRVRSSMIWGVMLDKSKLGNADFIDTIYSSDMSAACRYHCVNKWDENGIVLAARRDIVEAGLVPEEVAKLAKKLVATDASPKISGKGDVLYYIDSDTASVATEAKAFDKIAKKAKVKYATATAGECGKALKVLGYATEASEKLTTFVETINNSGAKKVVVSSPYVYDALVNDTKELGLKVKPAVMHVSEFVVSLKIKFAKKAGELYYLESDYLKNYNDNLKFPRELLKQLKAVSPAGFTTDILDEAIDFTFGTNNEESYTCGEGAVVMNVIRPELVKKMAKYVEARAVDVKNDVIVVASPYSKLQLSKNTKLKVSTLTELAASCL
ncbi:MAG: (Fe-S)-binding protein [Opitutales bacterium]|nr:(Fe-S)-binding protein [Opitutales bacterium]